MFKSFAITLLSTAALAASGLTDYSQKGANWGDICPTGKEQSPIDLPTGADNSSVQSVVVNKKYPDLASAKVENKGATINVYQNGGTMHPDAQFVKTFEDGSSIELQPVQFHMHQPSEHTIDGRQYDLEVHIVHTNADGQFGVLGFMFDSELGGDGENLFLGQIPLPNPDFTQSYGKDGFGNVIHTKNAKISLKGFMDSVDKTEFWSYNGSLTTPPCTEGIKWTVFSDIQPISKTQVEAFKALWGQYGNARETQPLNGRDLRLVSPIVEKSAQEEVAEAAAVTFGVLFGVVTLTLIVVLALLFGKPSCFNLEKTKKSAKSEKPADVPNKN